MINVAKHTAAAGADTPETTSPDGSTTPGERESTAAGGPWPGSPAAVCPGAEDGRCVGRPVNGAPCSYHAVYFRPDGSPR